MTMRAYLGASFAVSVSLGGCAQSRTSPVPPYAEGDYEGGLPGIDIVHRQASPTRAPADVYGGDVAHALTPIEQRLLDSLGPASKKHDKRVSCLVRELATHAPDHRNMPADLVEGLLWWCGLTDPPPRILSVEVADEDAPCAVTWCEGPTKALIQEVDSDLGDNEEMAIGVAVVGLPSGRTRLMIGAVDRSVALSPIAAEFADGQTVTVAGELADGHHNAEIRVIAPDGRSRTIAPEVRADSHFSGELACDRGSGRYQVEVLANGPYGIEVAANFPLFCGMSRPESIEYTVERVGAEVTAADIAAESLRLVNRTRRAQGLAALQWNDSAAAIALAHSQDMLDAGFVGHVSPSSGDAGARFDRAGVVGAVIRENVARGYGPRGIHQSLMNSPGHRVNILAADVTHAGVGVVLGEPESQAKGAASPIFLTQNFFRKPGEGAPRDLPRALRKLVDQKRRAAKLAPLRWDDRLSALAQGSVTAMARARPGFSEEAFKKRVFAMGYEKVERHRVSSPDHAALAELDLWLEAGRERHFGMGVARSGRNSEEGEGFLMLVIVGKR